MSDTAIKEDDVVIVTEQDRGQLVKQICLHRRDGYTIVEFSTCAYTKPQDGPHVLYSVLMEKSQGS
jgi:hypothetical protein